MTEGAPTVAVINAGGWGTALAVKLANQGYGVRLWARRPEMVSRIAAERENREYLPHVVVPPNVQVSNDLGCVLNGVDTVVIAVIASFVREVARRLRPLIRPTMLIVHGTKGLEPDTWMRPTAVLMDELGTEIGTRVAVLAGPNHAEEVARGLPAAAVLACADPGTAVRVQKLLATEWFRVYTNTDVIGVELCSAAKNVVAVAAGIGDGLGYGDNSKAALLTRGLAEVWRLVEHYGGTRATVSGLAGLGDVVATCTSPHSRNRWAGEQIGRGRTVKEIIASTRMVIEGIPSTRAVVEVARRAEVEMPICEGVYRVVFEGKRPDDVLSELMARGITSEG